MPAATYTWFLFVDASTPTTHILAWNPHIREWLIPCGTIREPHRDGVTYAPTKRLCRSCTSLTAGSAGERRRVGGERQ